MLVVFVRVAPPFQVRPELVELLGGYGVFELHSLAAVVAVCPRSHGFGEHVAVVDRVLLHGFGGAGGSDGG